MYTPYYPNRHIYIDMDNDDIPETEITNRVKGDISGNHGTKSVSGAVKTASAGRISFDIENSDGFYDLSAVDLVGKAVSVTLEYEGKTKQIFYGHIQPFDMDSGPVSPRHLNINVYDWLKVANGLQLRDLSLVESVTADEAIEALVETLDNPPSHLDLDIGTEKFPTVFDGSTNKAKIYSELDKITKSELGELYLTFRKTAHGETLRLENKYARGSYRSLSRMPSTPSEIKRLKYHGNSGATGLLKYHGNSGETGNLLIDTGQDAVLPFTHKSSRWAVGSSLLNEMSISNVVRTNDASPVVLYRLEHPIQIGTGQDIEINGNYTDPNGGKVIAATEVAAGDWTANTKNDNSGTDIGTTGTGGVQINFFAFATSFRAGFHNYGPPGFITSFEVEGLGRYKDNPVETFVEDLPSKQLLQEVHSENLAREYSGDITSSKMFINGQIALRRMTLREMLSVTYLASYNENVLMAFMYLEQGDKINIEEVFPEHSGDFYIQAVDFRITPGGVVSFTWYLKEEIETLCTPIAINAPASSAVSALDFGVLPYLSNMKEISYSFWIKKNETAPPFFAVMSRSVDTGTGRRGHEILVANDDNKIYFLTYGTPIDGEWSTSAAVLSSADTYYHVLITYDTTSDINDPVFYIDGNPVAVTEHDAPSGHIDDDFDCPLIFFNSSQNPSVPEIPYATVAENFTIKDFRIYQGIKSPADAIELASGEDDYSTSPNGLLFQGFFSPTDRIDDYVGDGVTEGDWVLDIVRGASANPYNEETAINQILTGETI